MALAIFVVVIVGSIMVHEAGHFFTARWFGMKAERFFFGFGPTLWSVHRGETEYGVKAIPAGGFVKIAGMNRYEDIDPADEPRAFYNRPAWQRAIVLVAGSFTHFVLAAVLLFVAMGFFELPQLEDGAPVGSTEITQIVPDSPAAVAGLQEGDELVALDGVSVETFEQVRDAIAARPGAQVELTYARDGRTATTPVTLDVRRDDEGTEVGFIGVGSERIAFQEWTLTEAFTGVWVGEYSLPAQTRSAVVGIAQVFRPDSLARWLAQADGDTPRTADGPVSLIGAGQAATALASIGAFSSVIVLLAQLQIIIGALNLLPLPPFDGGHLAVLVVESVVNAVRRRRGMAPDWQVEPSTLMPLTLAVLLLFGLFALTAIYVDIVNPISNLIQ
jgi:membrane-associated protease RseP (regulator of RpoE activity)